MHRFTTGSLLIIAGIIKILPIIGVLGAAQLAELYQLRFEEPNLLILMQHRAVLFGLLGSLFIYAAFRPVLQPIAFVAGFVSASSFILIALAAESYNAALARVIVADIVVVICIAVASGVWWIGQRRPLLEGNRESG